jgi:DNA-binding transcriptional MerR regulator
MPRRSGTVKRANRGTGDPASAPRSGGVELVKMAVLAKRSGVPTPTIKHYIREGLLPGPSVRTSRNMAYYDTRSVARIAMIKRLQNERFLPLRTIGELLEPAPSARLRADAASQRKTLRALAPAVTPPRETRRKRSRVIEMGMITAQELAKLERAGVLDLEGKGPSAGYAGTDLVLLDIINDVRRAGYGTVFPLALVTTYMTAVKTLVEVELELFRTHALSHQLPVALTDAARDAMQFGERLVIALRAKILPALLLPVGEPH